ncbi:hypothetical protein [Streptosporangium canum]|uniref:hypothetical protein n=1 Tax=Streptosporangium canum TaxID=324952 RepID=UPI003F4DE0BB
MFAGDPDRFQGFGGVDGEPVDQPGDGRTGGGRAEQFWLRAQECDVGQAATSQGEDDGEISDDLSGVVDPREPVAIAAIASPGCGPGR